MNVLQLPDIERAAHDLALSAKIAYEATSTAEDRRKAIAYLYSFQESAECKLQVAVGLSLLQSYDDGNHEIPPDKIDQYFLSFQLLQYCVAYSWNKLDELERSEVKVRLMNFVTTARNSTVTIPILVKEELAKLLVEIAKKEWPQLWSDFMPFVLNLIGSQQQDLTFLILRRMSEDVFSIENITNNERRRDLAQSLQMTSSAVLDILFKILNDMSSSTNTFNSANINLAKVVLSCTSSYCGFVDLQVLAANGRLAPIFHLLNNEDLRIGALDCLVEVLDRKNASKKDKSLILSLCLSTQDGFPSIQKALADNLAAFNNEDEDWTKKLDTFIITLANNCTIETTDVNNLVLLLLMLGSSKDPTRILTGVASANWFLRNCGKNKNVLKLEVLKDSFNQLIESVITGYFLNQDNKALTHQFSDFDASRMKSEFSGLIRLVGRYEVMLYLLGSRILGFLHQQYTNQQCTKQHLETLVFLMDHFASTVPVDKDEVIAVGLNDLNLFLQLFTVEKNLELKSILLSGVSANFCFLSLSKNRNTFNDQHQMLLQQIVTSLLQCYNTDQNDHDARGLRRHVTALLSKLTTKAPLVMNLISDNLVSSIITMLPSLSNFEFCGLIEVMLMLSNSWDDVGKQHLLLKEVMSQVDWINFSQMSSSVEALSKILLQEASFHENTSILIKSLSVLQAIICRIKIKVVQNPARDVVVQALPSVFQLIKSIHCLLGMPELKCVLDLRDAEQQQLMGMQNIDSSIAPSADQSEKSHIDKIKNIVLNSYELCTTIVGEACARYSPDIYMTPKFAELLLNSTCTNIQELNNFRLRHIIRSIFKPFLAFCPFELYESVAKSFFQQFGPFMFKRITESWTSLNIENLTNSNDSLSGDAPVAESLENAIVRLLIKDYLDVLIKLLEIQHSTMKERTENENNDLKQQDEEIGGEDMDVDGGGPSGGSTKKFSHVINDAGVLGLCLLGDASCFSGIIHLSAVATNWRDSSISIKATRILHLSWHYLSQHSDPDTIHKILVECLKGAAMWVKTEGNFDSLQKLVDKIILHSTQDPVMSQILIAWGVTQEDITKMCALFNEQQKGDKKRKELFLKWTRHNLEMSGGKELKVQWLKGLPSLESMLKTSGKGLNNGNVTGKEPIALVGQKKEFDLKFLFT